MISFSMFLQATHARLMISLPGFTVSPAEEVKSRNFSFKVYHTGTTFYFAAESGEDLAGWVESFSRVTVSEEDQGNLFWLILVCRVLDASAWQLIRVRPCFSDRRQRDRRRRRRRTAIG